MKMIFAGFLLVVFGRAQSQSLTFDDITFIYKSILHNIVTFQSYKFINENINAIKRGELDLERNLILLDTNEYFPITIKQLPITLNDSSLHLIEFNFEPNKVCLQKDVITPLGPDYFSPIITKGIVVFNKRLKEIKFISGDLFLNNAKFLQIKLQSQCASKDEAFKMYIWLRFYNYSPSSIRLSNGKIIFHSEVLKKNVVVKSKKIQSGN